MIEERGGRAAVSVCDNTVPDDVDGCIALSVERFGGIDILVNNATLVPHGKGLLAVDKRTRAGERSTQERASSHSLTVASTAGCSGSLNSSWWTPA